MRHDGDIQWLVLFSSGMRKMSSVCQSAMTGSEGIHKVSQYLPESFRGGKYKQTHHLQRFVLWPDSNVPNSPAVTMG